MQRLSITIAALVLASVMCFLAFLLAGFGHGTYIPVALAASPTLAIAALLRGGESSLFWFGLCAAPLYWVGIVWFLAGSHSRKRFVSLALLTLQYSGVVPIFIWADERSDSFPKMFHYSPLTMIAFFLLYGLAQATIWTGILRRNLLGWRTKGAHLR